MAWPYLTTPILLAVALVGLPMAYGQDAAPAPNLATDVAEAPSAPLAPRIMPTPRWLERPTQADWERYYPSAAREQGVTGSVLLNCIVNAIHRLDCEIDQEEPVGWGFGGAALSLSQRFLMIDQLSDGTPTEGGRVRVPFRFNVGASPAPAK